VCIHQLCKPETVHISCICRIASDFNILVILKNLECFCRFIKRPDGIDRRNHFEQKISCKCQFCAVMQLASHCCYISFAGYLVVCHIFSCRCIRCKLNKFNHKFFSVFFIAQNLIPFINTPPGFRTVLHVCTGLYSISIHSGQNNSPYRINTFRCHCLT
jgi:hypothetical protein